MKKFLASSLLIVSALISANVAAGSISSQLGTCLTDSMNGKERKLLAKWVFFAMAAHPEISNSANVSKSDRDEADKFVGNLMTRLITSDCPTQFKAAMNENGSMALKAAFGLVGQVAMRELMTDKSVSNSFRNYVKYLNKEKIRALSKE